ncbi:MAG: tRNA (adenosine(37)-N6)-dimethylallyltransferase MiaA [Proteobacteria bacterium]|nr:tRNA (adenosine(37)-N6)-dimethylallyltransferase MiaA [Pseudomonadota bacterium]MBU1649416.1 tRNA (adenosine(37)-N6)-dimethylallyltransferase MiaA [Pseudomonadota bacterium]MBU1986557.1 tRNA (adenosine(37)-N6)-dimethylallyltransferase MiaA [Pseudomonadota bacterium]
MQSQVLVVVGPTAIGKTELSLLLAERFGCEIVSVDSMQVYKYMDIGTAKVSLEERARIPHHLIDVVEPDAEYDAASFVRDALQAIEQIHRRGRVPLLTGGTGLYLRALIEGLSSGIGHFPEIREQLQQRMAMVGPHVLHEELALYDRYSAERIHVNDTHRLLRALEIYQATGKPWSEHILEHKEQKTARFSNILQIGLTCERDLLYQRIDLRTRLMLKSGLEEEVRRLIARGYSPQLKSMQSIGYRHMNNYLEGIWDMKETERLLARDTRRYAKRQYTWFAAIPELEWFEVQDQKKIRERIEKWMG